MKPNDTITALPKFKLAGYNHSRREVFLTVENDVPMPDAARYAINACNALPACIEAMEEALCWISGGEDRHAAKACLDQLKAALALARGENGKP